jgi:hypothetical protein
MLFNLALDSVSGPDPSLGSIISSGSGFFVNQRRPTPYVWFQQILYPLTRTSVRQSSSLTVLFIVGIARFANAMTGWLRTSPGRSGSEYWTRIRSFSSFFTYAPKKTSKVDAYRTVRNADPNVDAGSVVRWCAVLHLFTVPVRGRTRGSGLRSLIRVSSFKPRTAPLKL